MAGITLDENEHLGSYICSECYAHVENPPAKSYPNLQYYKVRFKTDRSQSFTFTAG